jgi:hypothetical protein
MTGQRGLFTPAVERGCALGDKVMADFAQGTWMMVSMVIYNGFERLNYWDEVELGLGCFDLDVWIGMSFMGPFMS